MDFLDPARKRSHNIRLFIGYGLMTILVTLVALFAIYGAYGYDIDRKTGEIIQNGLIFVNTLPESAAITINGRTQSNRTDARFSLPSGHYSVELSRDGYQTWKHDLDLEGGSIERLNYARIFPTKLEPAEAQVLNETPALITQTPDKNHLLVQLPAQITAFYSYDLGAAIGGDTPPVSTVILPAELLSPSLEKHKLAIEQWSSDNRHFLLRHDFGASFEFLVIDRENPNISFNVNKKFNLNPSQIELQDRRFDQFYLLSGSSGTLQNADARNGAVSTVADNVGTFKSFGDDTLIYSQKGSAAGTIKVLIRQGNKTFALRELPAVQVTFVDIGRYGNRFYYVIGANDGKTYIYKDPVGNFFAHDPLSRPTPIVLLQLDKTEFVEFSPSNRFVSTRGGGKVAVYDIEMKRKFRFEIKETLLTGQGTPWMDDHRLVYASGGLAGVVDFDGVNQRDLIALSSSTPIIFDRDYRWLYSVAPSTSKPNQPALFRTSLRATN